jgi:hypothetical protein
MTTTVQSQGYQSCQRGDVGIALIVDVVDQDCNPVDIRTATSLQIALGYPSGETSSFEAVFLTDGSDGKMVYYTEEGDLNEAGEYIIQGIVTMGGAEKSTKRSTFLARDNVLPADI